MPVAAAPARRPAVRAAHIVDERGVGDVDACADDVVQLAPASRSALDDREAHLSLLVGRRGRIGVAPA
jgi:hypothetical protein